MSDADCRRACEAWMAALDEGTSPTQTVAYHVGFCPDCRAFTQATLQAGESLRSLSRPEADPAADIRLLARLRESRRTPVSRRVFSWFETWREAPRPALRLAGAGVASFAVTLLVAGTLSLGAGSASPGSQAPPLVPAGQYSREIDSHLDDWLESPSPSVVRPLSVPAPGQPARQRPRRLRGENSLGGRTA
jgi:hypothetical protein